MNNYCCGWYFQCQSKEQTLAVIPSIHVSKGKRTGCVQLITNTGNWSASLPYAKLQTNGGRICAVMGENVFSYKGIRLSLHTDSLDAEGMIRFGRISPIRYDIMGPFRYVPFMECRHSVFSMQHTVNGRLRINGVDYIFQDGTGYIEGDRGYSFPKHYAWTQYGFNGGSLMLSVAEIPLGPASFTGTIGIVQMNGEEYRLATYLGAKVIRLQDNQIAVRQGNLMLTAQLLGKNAFDLQAPKAGAMDRLIRENVSCPAYYRFYQGEKMLFHLDAKDASFEYEYPL